MTVYRCDPERGRGGTPSSSSSRAAVAVGEKRKPEEDGAASAAGGGAGGSFSSHQLRPWASPRTRRRRPSRPLRRRRRRRRRRRGRFGGRRRARDSRIAARRSSASPTPPRAPPRSRRRDGLAVPRRVRGPGDVRARLRGARGSSEEAPETGDGRRGDRGGLRPRGIPAVARGAETRPSVRRPEPEDLRRVHPVAVRRGDGRRIFETVGPTREVKILRQADGRHKGSGFVTYDDVEAANRAIHFIDNRYSLIAPNFPRRNPST